MPQIREIGRVYMQVLRLRPGAPIFHTAPTQETEPPYRVGRSLVVRLWPSIVAVVLGRWVSRRTDSAAAELDALRLLTVPRTAGPQDWCEDCGATKCLCHEEDPGFCPQCLSEWEWCQCLKHLDTYYRSSS